MEKARRHYDLFHNELKKRIAPVAEKYRLNAVYLFGSYARNEATDDSDVDVLVDRTDSKVKSAFDMGGLYNDLCESICKEVDWSRSNIRTGKHPATDAVVC
jgi:predicted nucleotidyltransferase